MKESVVQAGVAVKALPGQTFMGDVHLIHPFKGGCLIAVVDGLGHGEEAARAAGLAVSTLTANASTSVISLLRECHDALRGTRGVVMSLASFNVAEQTMTWAGVGNVEGALLRKEGAQRRELLLVRAGVVGHQLPPLAAVVMAITTGDTLIFATDGIQSDFWRDLRAEEAPQKMAERILTAYGRGTDDALVVTARYQGCAR